MPKQGYSVPTLYRYNGDVSKEWYVGFRFTCPNTLKRKPVQVRTGINYFKTAKERDREAVAVIALVKQCLEDGWHPHLERMEAFLQRTARPTETEPETQITEVNVSSITFLQALKFALEKKRKFLKGRSLQAYEYIYRFAEKAAPAVRLDKPYVDVKRIHIKLLLEQIALDRQKAYRKGGHGIRKGQPFTPNAYNKYRKNLSALCGEVNEWCELEYNPCAKIKNQERIDTGIHRHATDVELQIIKEKLPFLHPQLYNFLRFEYISGMRPGEIQDTKFDMVDELNSCIKLSDIKLVMNSKGETVSKTKTFRMVPIPRYLLEWIVARGKNYPPHYYIFSSGFMPGEHRHAQGWASRCWERVVKKGLGIDVSLYSFKGLGGDAKRDAGVEFGGVMLGFGHTKPSTTSIYLSKEGERLRRQIIEKAPDL